MESRVETDYSSPAKTLSLALAIGDRLLRSSCHQRYHTAKAGACYQEIVHPRLMQVHVTPAMSPAAQQLIQDTNTSNDAVLPR